jgi:hypothetical protein
MTRLIKNDMGSSLILQTCPFQDLVPVTVQSGVLPLAGTPNRRRIRHAVACSQIRKPRIWRTVVRTIRVVIEFQDSTTGARLMRWEKRAPAETSAFELLGRAFEAVQREETCSIGEAVEAFLRGALLQKQDIIDALGDSS